VHKCYPKATLFATAFSLGANVLTKYVGEEGGNTPLAAAIAVANPLDWFIIDQHLKKPFNKHSYNFILTKALVSYLKRHKEVFEGHDKVEIDRVLQISTLQEYDQLMTCPLWGFKSVDEYYEVASGKNYLDGIRIPFLIVQALDDPIIPKEVIPYKKIYENSNLILATTEYGGHLGWLQGLNPSAENWVDGVCVQFTRSVMDHMAAQDLSDI
jgi:uncharacterized protein